MYIVEPEVVKGLEDNQAIDFPDIIKAKTRWQENRRLSIGENNWMDMGQLERWKI